MSNLDEEWSERERGQGAVQPKRKFADIVRVADETVSLLLKAGLLLGATIAAGIVIVLLSTAIRSSGIVVGRLTNPGASGEYDKDLTPRVLNYLSKAESSSVNLVPLFSELSDPPKIRVQVSGADFSLDQLVAILDKTLGNSSHIDGEVYKAGEKWGMSLRLNGVAIPGGDAQSDDLQSLIQSSGDRIIGMTQPILFAQIMVDRSKNSKNDIPTIERALDELSDFEPFYNEDRRTQALVAQSNLQQAIGDLPTSVRILRDALRSESGNSLIESELATRAFFSGDAELALQSARDANEHWNRSTEKIISPAGLAAMKAMNIEFISRVTGDFGSAQRAVRQYVENESSPYAKLDEDWESTLHLLKDGSFPDAAAHAKDLPTWAENRSGEKADFVEGPAEYNMYLAIMKGDWGIAYANALYADKIHVCQEPTKQYQRAAIHKPWTEFLADKAGTVAPLIHETAYNKPDHCYLCLRLEAHRALTKVSDARSSMLAVHLREAEADFGRAIEIAPAVPFAYLERGMLRDILGLRKEAGEDLRRAAALGPKWKPVSAYTSFRRSIEKRHETAWPLKPSSIIEWSIGSAGLGASEATLVATAYIDPAKVQSIIGECQKTNPERASTSVNAP